MRSTKQSLRVGITTAEVNCWTHRDSILLSTTKTILVTLLFTMLSALQPVIIPKSPTGMLSKNLCHMVLILTQLRMIKGSCLIQWSSIVLKLKLVTRNNLKKCLTGLKTVLKSKSKLMQLRHSGTLTILLSVKVAWCLDSKRAWMSTFKRNMVQMKQMSERIRKLCYLFMFA